MKKIISLFIIICVLGLGYYYYISQNRNIVVANNISNVDNTSENNMEGKIKIIAVGDSLTAGYGLNLSDSYPAQLEAKLLQNNYNVEVINAGVSGETTAGLLERVEFIKKQNPEIVLITIGGNDALRNLPVEQTENNILKIVQSLKETVNEKNIYLMKIQAPLNLGVSYVSKFSNIYKNVEQKEGINLVDFVVTEVFLDNELMQSDGIHPNKEGYKIIVEKHVYPAITQFFK